MTDPYSGQAWQASVAECTPSTARRPPRHEAWRASALGRAERGLSNGEEGEHVRRIDAHGGEVTHVIDHDRGEMGPLGQLGQCGGRLSEDAVDTGRAVGVRGNLGHNQHVVGHRWSVRLVRGCRRMVQYTVRIIGGGIGG